MANEIHQALIAYGTGKMSGEITRVTSEELPNGYYRYHAHFKDSDPIVIRKKATRLYENAFLYSTPHGNGSGLLALFGFGKKPDSYRKLLKVFPIKAANLSWGRTWYEHEEQGLD